MNKFAVILVVTFAAMTAAGQTAHDYYNDLVKKGGLEGFTNEFVCFKDDQSDTFFTFSKSEDLKRDMKDSGQFPDSVTKRFNGHFLLMLGYNKGIAQRSPEVLDKDPDSVSDSYTDDLLVHKQRIRLRFTINWKTLRFKRSIEKPDGEEVFRLFGTCIDRTAIQAQ